MPTRDEATAALQERAVLTLQEAEGIVDAVAAVAVEDAMAQIAGEEPATGTAAELRATRVARICTRLGRLLSTREIEVLLRVPPPTAAATLGRVRAGWPEQSDTWIAELIRSQKDVVEDASTEEDGERWRIVFNDDAVLDYAIDRLRREGMSRGISVSRTKQALVVPKEMRARSGQMRDPLVVLGLQ